ncbi:hyoscyamine 6-dioxygenase-like [Neltuma alba]|uniref:hyoscyamine 6-dioxygenase-like n=1 Tax=Neltuma alba TaxID=207710 RepID=UPI0010A4C08B|nr:hyoscyamine 6-dioxygenase-like [Prosopis alba]
MEKLVSNWYKNVGSVPENYIFPAETRPGKFHVPMGEGIPVIDLSEAEEGHRTLTIQKILKASQEFGFFQVINHGVSEKLMEETINVLKEFFQMPDEDKKHLYSEDFKNDCILSTSCMNYGNEKVHQWRDFLKHSCHPLYKWQKFWPENPPTYREIVGACSVEVKKLSSRILGLIAEGLGLESGYFEDELSEHVALSAHQYPPCPDPTLTLGTRVHVDANIITILLQDHVYGLQIFKDDTWLGVPPNPHAFVVNIGTFLQVISNDKLKSVKHRVVTNTSKFRASAGFFVSALEDTVIKPARAVTDELNTAIYKPFTAKDFIMHYFQSDGDIEATIDQSFGGVNKLSISPPTLFDVIGEPPSIPYAMNYFHMMLHAVKPELFANEDKIDNEVKWAKVYVQNDTDSCRVHVLSWLQEWDGTVRDDAGYTMPRYYNGEL